MGEKMKIEFYGVRGSFPVPGNQTAIYGGNTTCVSISTTDSEGKIQRLIIDSGTGIIKLGKDIIGNFFKKQEDLELYLLFTHLHPDHTQGFPFFGPNFFRKCHVKLFGMEALGKNIGDILSEQMSPPNFPIELRHLKSNHSFIVLEDGEEFAISPSFEIKVMQAFAPSHPQQGAMYYKITEKSTGKSVACIWDNESKIGGDKAVINFIKGVDLLIHDTQYTKEEYESSSMVVQGFGHSTYDMAVDNATQAGVKKLTCIHYNPSHTDEKLKEIEESFKSKNLPFSFEMSREGSCDII